MKWRLLCAAVVVEIACASILADVVLMSPSDPYDAVMQAGIWMPGRKIYALGNTTASWVYWRASTASGQVICEPAAGWIAPAECVSVMLCPAGSMVYATPGVYSDQVRLDFDARVVGDVDGDGVVDVTDLVEVVATFGSDDARGDFNRNGVVDIGDVLQLVNHFGRQAGQTSI